jgi:superfamily I DNA and RNA helicase
VQWGRCRCCARWRCLFFDGGDSSEAVSRTSCAHARKVASASLVKRLVDSCKRQASLNAQQRPAVEHGIGTPEAVGHGPLLVIAGAGSGKTNTLAHRVAHLVARGADPQRILLVTSRRVAAEMERRAGRFLAVSSALADCGNLRTCPG